MTKVKKSSILLTCLLLALLCGLLFYIDGNASKYIISITRLCAINIVLALSMNLVNGFTGIFSLGHAGFMAIGAYTVALLTIPVAKKETIFMLEPLIAPLNTLTLPFGAALIIGGLLAAALAFLIGLPCLRLRGDYLAIATLGFSEIIRIVITNAQSLTNGAQGLKSIPATANIWWCYGVALATIVFIALLISSSYGRAFKAIREDEIAAESIGVSLLRHKMLSFMLSAFLAAVGGGLFASYIGTIGPDVFQVSRTYDILMIVVMGGMGSISGSVLAAFIVTIGQEWLRVLDEMDNKPKILLVENVAGLLSTNGGDNYRVLHLALTERGYRCGAILLNASHFVPQSRPRVFIIAVREDCPIPAELVGNGPCWLHNNAATQLGRKLPGWVWWHTEKPPRRVVSLKDIVEDDATFDKDDVLRLVPERHQTKVRTLYTVCATGYRRTRNGTQQLELRFDGIAGCLRTPEGGSSKQYLVVKKNGQTHARLLTVREAARLMGAPDSFVLPGSYNDGYKAMGDAVAAPVARFIGERFLTKIAEAVYDD